MAEGPRARSTSIHSAELLLRKKIDERFLPLPNPPSLRGRFCGKGRMRGRARAGEHRCGWGSSREFMSGNNIRWVSVDGFRGAWGTMESAAPYTKRLIPISIYVHLLTNICYFYFLLNSPVSYNLTPLVPEGTEHRLGGLHPGAPSLFLFRSRAGSPPAYCACRHWASRTRAVSLLTGGLVQ